MKHPLIMKDFPHMIHGADYNPDQWLDTPEIICEDFRLAKLAGMNSFSVGIFAWSALEPEEGHYTFEWLDDIMDRIAAMGGKAVLATPSGARPAWMARKYPEVLRTDARGVQALFGERHNHCFTSPVYREKTAGMNRLLAQRYGKHPALGLWHISNEFSGECHCELCQKAFRDFLRTRYDNSLDKLNRAWWTSFWSHRYSDWEEIHSPGPRGEMSVHGMNLDWKRFVTHQTVDYYLNECAPVRALTPDIPVTTNFMWDFMGFDYEALVPHMDVVSWDAYPTWHHPRGDMHVAMATAFMHSWFRAMKRRPFLLMESTPTQTNWQPVCKLKRPGVHTLASLQAVAHGSDSVQYFQWRKSRGSCEKFHGAVVDHTGTEHTRVFREIADLGQTLSRLGDIPGTSTRARVAVIYDAQNRWALEDARGPRNEGRDYTLTCMSWFKPFWDAGIPVDITGADADFTPYDLVIAPMMYMVREGFREKAEALVARGGQFITTYFSGVADASDLCFLGGFPGPLRPLLGIWAEELDAIHDSDTNSAETCEGSDAGLAGNYGVHTFCERVHPEGARVHAVYTSDFYAGMPVVTENRFGEGKAWYVAARTDERLIRDMIFGRIADLNLSSGWTEILPEPLRVACREDDTFRYAFVMNFTDQPHTAALPENAEVLEGSRTEGALSLDAYGCAVVKYPKQ